MPIKLTVREAIQVYQAIEMLPKLPDPKTGYHLGRIGDFCEQESRRYEKELRKLQDQVVVAGQVGKDGNRKVQPEKMKEYTEGIDKLLDIEVEIPRDTVTFDEVVGADQEKRPVVEPAVWRALGKIIVEKKG